MQKKTATTDQRKKPDISGRRKNGKALANRLTAAQQQVWEVDRPPLTCTFLTIDQVVNLTSRIRCLHLEVRLLLGDPKPTSAQVIEILSNGLHQLRDRHELTCGYPIYFRREPS
jgi:hypothetical protein